MKKPKIAKPSFSDKAKVARGIDVSSFEKKMAHQKAEHDIETHGLKLRIESLVNAGRSALKAFEEGRRGDGMKLMRSAFSPPSAPSPRSPDAGGNAA